ncbi:MAG: 3-hydroxyacyl-CoA dehydrogenase NAD-binding domain-containing protein [Smithellaceae bacterium]|nr:3-hydroxyacyl-CoA dehydrogenase NAD-binding domain-containing protein [Smithellaceae bacterium]
MSKVFELRVEGGIGVVTFSVPGETMNTWSEVAFRSFNDVLSDLEQEKGLRGAIFISGKPDNFLAGANLKQLSQLESREEARQVIEQFLHSFNRLTALKFPTLAAVHGYCLGGGLEFALACTAIIAKEGKTSLIGLPECNVGLFPGGGGTQRLPRLIGYPAIELIVKGTMLPAAKAKELGILDRLVPPEADLLTEAKAFLEELLSGKFKLNRPTYDFSELDEKVELARQGLLKATRGRELPGPLGALKSIREGLKLSLAEGLVREKDNFIEVVLTNEAKGSINTFFLKTMTDKPKSLMTKGFVPKELKKLVVLGLGTMGRGIVVDSLRHTKIKVVAVDLPEALAPGKAAVEKVLAGMIEKKKLREPLEALMGRLEVVSGYGACRDADLIIEAVFEDLKLKEALYREVSSLAGPEVIIASNTSSIPINSMAPFVAHPERFAGLHFFSPVWLMQLVEIIRGKDTAQDTVDNLLNYAALIQKRPLVCGDYPGFVVNALLSPYIMLSLKYLEEGNSIEKIDQALRDFGMPVGPIQLIDGVGIDVPYKVSLGKGEVQETLRQVVESGRLGLRKSGRGFFLADGSVDPEVLPLIAARAPRELSPVEIRQGLLSAMVKVGKTLLDLGIVQDPKFIDVGMIWGVGFPADKGGPLKWSDLTGLSKELFGGNFY